LNQPTPATGSNKVNTTPPYEVACGGIIAVNAAEFDVTNHKISEFFDSHPLDVWGFGIFSYRALAFIEHAAFWFGALTLVGTFPYAQWRDNEVPTTPDTSHQQLSMSYRISAFPHRISA
jgi:hypothetical protein